MQRMLNRNGRASDALKLNGEFDEAMIRQLQTFLNQQLKAARDGDADAELFWKKYGRMFEAASGSYFRRTTAITRSLEGYNDLTSQAEAAEAKRQAERDQLSGAELMLALYYESDNLFDYLGLILANLGPILGF